MKRVIWFRIRKPASPTNTLYTDEMNWRTQHLCLNLCLKCCVTVYTPAAFQDFFVLHILFMFPANCAAATLGDTSIQKMDELSAEITEGRCLVSAWIIWNFFQRVNSEIIVGDAENCTAKCTKSGRQLLSGLMWQTLTVVGWPKQKPCDKLWDTLAPKLRVKRGTITLRPGLSLLFYFCKALFVRFVRNVKLYKCR